MKKIQHIEALSLNLTSSEVMQTVASYESKKQGGSYKKVERVRGDCLRTFPLDKFLRSCSLECLRTMCS